MHQTDSEKNMSNSIPQTQPIPPPAGNPVENRILHPIAQPPVPQQQQQQPLIQMTPAERMGINNLVNEFRRTYENNFAPLVAEFQDHQALETAIYWICREVDTLQRQGQNTTYILTSDVLMTRIATAASSSLRAGVPFQNLPFMTQVFLMNLTIFVVRSLAR